jgi:hypothetical protein
VKRNVIQQRLSVGLYLEPTCYQQKSIKECCVKPCEKEVYGEI